jgi:hypothetical protein
MPEKKIPSGWEICNESYVSAGQLKPGGGDFGKSFNGAEGLRPKAPTNSNTTQPSASTNQSNNAKTPNTPRR